jgi:hypothetical protein
MSTGIFSSGKILGDFFLRNAHGEENFTTRHAGGVPQTSKIFTSPFAKNRYEF